MITLPQPVRTLVASYDKKRPQDLYGKDEPKIKVHAAISRMAFIYEKVRNAIDYKDEHLLRKNAIERMIKRRLYTEEKRVNLGRLVLTEIIRARYLPNNTIPERVIGEVDTIINKYLPILDAVAPNRLTKARREASNWILALLATEIEHHLVPPIQDDALVECMYSVMRQDVDLAEHIVDPVERDLQVYLAIHRALIKSDEAILRHHLFHFFVPAWKHATPEVVREVIENFWGVKESIDAQIRHPFGDRLLRFIRRFSILFTILRDVIDEDPKNFSDLVANPQAFEEKVRTACAAKYKKSQMRLRRSYIRAIIYIFFTKMLLALFLEFPYDKWIIHTTHYLPLIANILFHPTVMLVIAVSIRMPTKKNTDRIVEFIRKIATQEPEPGFIYKKRKIFKRSRFVEYFFNVVYLLAFLVSFGLIIGLLKVFAFNFASGVIFIMFLTLISFFGVKIRNEVKELVIVDEKDNLVTILIDFFSIPILRVGQWISSKTPKINLFVFVLDFIIEAPFKIFIEVIEDWVSFQREKKEELY